MKLDSSFAVSAAIAVSGFFRKCSMLESIPLHQSATGAAVLSRGEHSSHDTGAVNQLAADAPLGRDNAAFVSKPTESSAAARRGIRSSVRKISFRRLITAATLGLATLGHESPHSAAGPQSRRLGLSQAADTKEAKGNAPNAAPGFVRMGAIGLSQRLNSSYAAAVNYLGETSASSKTLGALINDTSHPGYGQISIMQNVDTNFEGDIATINWNDTCKEIVTNDDGVKIGAHSPAATLLREIIAAGHQHDNIVATLTRSVLPHPEFGTLERKRLVEEFNTAVRDLTGEPPMSSYPAALTQVVKAANISDTSLATGPERSFNGIASLMPDRHDAAAVNQQIQDLNVTFQTRGVEGWPESFNDSITATISELFKTGANLTRRYSSAYADHAVSADIAQAVNDYAAHAESVASGVHFVSPYLLPANATAP